MPILSDFLSGGARQYVMAIPYQSGELVYNGTSQEPTWVGFNEEELTISGEISAVDAGTYTVTFTPKPGYYWYENRKSNSIAVEWSIGKAEASISLSATSITTWLSHSTTINVTYNGDGNVVVESSDSSIVTAAFSGTTITLDAKQDGNVTISVYATEGANYVAAEKVDCAVECLLAYDTLNENSWEQIRDVADKGLASSIWSVGDIKDVELNGTVRGVTFSGHVVAMIIIGFNHNSSIEGKNTIHFQVGYTYTPYADPYFRTVCFVDDDYGYWKGNSCFNMSGNGWIDSIMRNNTCSEFKKALPTSLQNILLSIKKYTYNGSSVSSTEDSIFLLSEYEIYGIRTYADTSEQDYQKRYTFYSTSGSSTKYGVTPSTSGRFTNGEGSSWWTRSAVVETSYASGTFVVTNGSTGTTRNGNFSYGFAPAFAV